MVHIIPASEGCFTSSMDQTFCFAFSFLFSFISEHSTISSSSLKQLFLLSQIFYDGCTSMPNSPSHMPFLTTEVAHTIKFSVFIFIYFCFLLIFFFFIFIFRASFVSRFVAILTTLSTLLFVLLIVHAQSFFFFDFFFFFLLIFLYTSIVKALSPVVVRRFSSPWRIALYSSVN